MSTIQATVEMSVSDLQPYRKNPRKGNVALIKESLETHGQYRAVVVNRGNLTGRTNEVLAGNHTVFAARDLGWPTVAVHLLDVDDETARKIVLVDNKSNDAASYDSDELIELLGETADLIGTGFSDEEIQAMITPPEDFVEDEDLLSSFDVIVVCESSADQTALIARMEREGRQVRKVKSYSEV